METTTHTYEIWRGELSGLFTLIKEGRTEKTSANQVWEEFAEDRVMKVTRGDAAPGIENYVYFVRLYKSPGLAYACLYKFVKETSYRSKRLTMFEIA